MAKPKQTTAQRENLKKHAGGRPSKFEERYVDEAYKLALLGHTDKEMAGFWEVSEQTVNAWKGVQPEFLEALTRGKERADARVAHSLFQRAVGGHEQDAVKIFMPAGAAAPVYAPYVEKYPPDVTAAIFWLKNRQRGKWRDKQDHELTGKDGGPIKTEHAVLDASSLDAEDRAALRAVLKAAKGKGE